MGDVNLPLSGPVVEAFKIWTSWFSGNTNQIGLVNVNLGKSSDANLERDIITDAASYGKQLGRIEDVLVVLVKHLDKSRLSEQELTAVHEFKRVIDDIADVRAARTDKPSLRLP